MYIIRYYTFVGDAFMNTYLRDLNKDQYKNYFITNNIKLLWRLIHNAPSFSKPFSVYRRIGFDYLSKYKIGDIYTTESFLSTTRNQLYEPEGFTFGNIVLKINLPANKKGVGLMIELYSHFPEELEVLISPNIQLKLVKKNWKYYHYNKSNQNDVKTTYEFDVVGVKDIKIPTDKLSLSFKPKLISFYGLNMRGKTLNNKANNFVDTYLNNNLQFETFIGRHKYLFYVYFYDSTSTYSDLYKYKTKNGFSIVHQNKQNSQICLFLEFGKDLHVNYHVRYHDMESCPKFIDVSDNYNYYRDYLIFLRNIAKSFNINKVIIHPNIFSCNRFYKNAKNKNLHTQFLYRNTTYDNDLYNYYDPVKATLIGCPTPLKFVSCFFIKSLTIGSRTSLFKLSVDESLFLNSVIIFFALSSISFRS